MTTNSIFSATAWVNLGIKLYVYSQRQGFLATPPMEANIQKKYNSLISYNLSDPMSDAEIVFYHLQQVDVSSG